MPDLLDLPALFAYALFGSSMTAVDPTRRQVVPPPMPRYVLKAHKMARGEFERARCGRQLKSASRTCAIRRTPFMPSCTTHATPAERVVGECRRARVQAVADRWWASLRPASAGWPVRESDCVMVRQAMADCADEIGRTNAAWAFLWQWQQGRCGVCGFGWPPQPPPEDNHRWRFDDFVPDHDHATGMIRGYLCRSCNISEGFGGHGGFAEYRRNPPAARLGIAARYWCDFTGGWARCVRSGRC